MKNILRFFPLFLVLLSLLLPVPAAAETTEDRIPPSSGYEELNAEVQALSRAVEDLQLAIEDLKVQNRDMTVRMETLIALIAQNENAPETTDFPLPSSGTEKELPKILRYLPFFFLVPALILTAVILFRRRPVRFSVSPRRKNIMGTGNTEGFYKDNSFGTSVPETSAIPRSSPEKIACRIDFNACPGEDSDKKEPEEKKSLPVPEQKHSPEPASPAASLPNDLFVQAAAGTDVMQQLKSFSILYCSPTSASLKEVQQKAVIPENRNNIYRSYRLFPENSEKKTAPFLLINNTYLYPNLPINSRRIPHFWNALDKIQPYHIFSFKDLNDQSIRCNSAYKMQLVQIVPAEVQLNPGTDIISITRRGKLIFR